MKLWKKTHFFSSPRQGNMERKSKFKTKLKFLYFRPHKRLFGSEKTELNGGERSVFDVYQRSKQLIEVLKCVYDVTNSETLSTIFSD